MSLIDDLRAAVAWYANGREYKVTYKKGKYYTTIRNLGPSDVTFVTKSSAVKNKDSDELAEYVRKEVRSFFHGER